MIKIGNIFFGLLILASSVLFFSDDAYAGSVCSENASQIPVGQVVTSTSFQSSCLSNTRLTFGVPSTGSNGTRMCSNFTLIPSGFVVIEIGNQVDCNGSGFGTGVATYRIKIPAAGTTQTSICSVVGGSNFESGVNVPEGYVVINKSLTSSSCATSGTGTQWRIRIPTASGATRICPAGDVPIPPGFVVTRDKLSAAACSGGIGQANTQLEIRPPEENLNICNGYNGIPDGFANIGSSSSTSICSFGTTRIGTPQHNNIVCGIGEPPPGFVKTTIQTEPTCAFNLGFIVYELSRLGNTQTLEVCGSGSNAPDGFIVTQISTSSACATSGVGNSYRIRRPATSGNSNTCSSNFPDGYGVVSTTSSTACSNIGSATQYTIQPFSNGSNYCTGVNTPIPTGWVITRINSAGNCSSGFNMTIGLPNSSGNTNICENDPNNIPAGFVLVGTTPTSVCGSSSTAFIIRTPVTNGDTLVCDLSPVPTDFTVIQNGITNAQCPLNGLSKIIRSINVSGTFNICPGSPVPDGFVIIAKPSSTACSPFVNVNTITAAVTSGTMNVCHQSPLPTGFVIYKILTVGACNTPSTDLDMEVGFPNPTGTTVTCSSPPTGFVTIGTVPTTNCGLATTANLIAPAGLLLPSEFVDPIKNVTPGSVPAVNFNCGGNPQNGGFVNNQPKLNTTCN